MCDSGLNCIEVNGNKVWFEKLGSGPNVVLLLPGPIGTTRTDFNELLDGEDEFDFDKFTVIGVDPPGTGKSRPPLRQFGKDVYNNDCEAYRKIMQHLGIPKISIIGWSEGAKVALLLAAKYPKAIESLVLVGITSQLSNKGVNALLSKKLIDSWTKDRIGSYLKVYESKEEIQKLWTRYVKFVEFYNQYIPGDIFKDKYQLVQCPVLIVHGDKDQIVEVEQVMKLSKLLPRAKVYRLPNGDHECFIKYSDRFSELVQDHIINRHKFHGDNEECFTNSYDNSGQLDCYTASYDRPMVVDQVGWE